VGGPGRILLLQLFLMAEAPEADGFSEQDHENDAAHEDGRIARRLHDAEGDEQRGGEGSGLAGMEEKIDEDGEAHGGNGCPNAVEGDAGGGYRQRVPAASNVEGAESGRDPHEVANENAVGLCAAPVGGFDELVGGGAEAGEDQGLMEDPADRRGHQEQERLAQRRNQQIPSFFS